jgi:hypothetical protein
LILSNRIKCFSYCRRQFSIAVLSICRTHSDAQYINSNEYNCDYCSLESESLSFKDFSKCLSFKDVCLDIKNILE